VIPPASSARWLAPLLFVASLAGCDRPAPVRPEEIRTVQVVRVGMAIAPRSVELAGDIRARHETRLGFQVGGRIVERLVEVGSTVAARQPIARIDLRDVKLAADQAQAQLTTLETDRDLAAMELRRARELHQRGFLSPAELDRRESAHAATLSRIDNARAQLQQARNQLGYATLTSDHAGVVTAIEAEVGQVVAVGQTVARLARAGELEAAVAIPEGWRTQIAASQSIEVRVTAIPGRTWTGRLREMAPAADPATRTYAARIAIASPGADLALGMSARVVITDASATAGTALPPAAIHARTGGPQVWVIDANDTARARPVVTGGVGTDAVIVVSGLAAGERVVVAGAQLLREGQKVRVQERTAAAPAG
jgi:RND family efflux transporter MFP subunit